MSRVIDANHAEPVIRAMVGAADVDTGPTAEQLAIIGALAAGYFEVDLDPAAVESLSPQATAAAFVEPEQRRRVRELLVLVELCRHPSSPSQAARIEEYCASLGESGPGLAIARDLVDRSRAEAAADYMRFFAGAVASPMLEPQLADRYGASLDAPDPALATRLRALADAPAGTLGRAYVLAGCAVHRRLHDDRPPRAGPRAAGRGAGLLRHPRARALSRRGNRSSVPRTRRSADT